MKEKFNNFVDPLKEDFSSEGKPSGLQMHDFIVEGWSMSATDGESL